MRALLVIAFSVFCMTAQAAAPMRGLPPEVSLDVDGLHAIAGWLRSSGRDGYIGADVADAIGIPRRSGEEMLEARQRGFRNDDVLRIAQVLDNFLLFMVQRPDDQVYFYLSTPRGGLQKAFVSIPSRNQVVPLEPFEAQLRFRQEVHYWMDHTR